MIYLDIDANNGGGFDHPTLGEARRNTLCAVLDYVETVLDAHSNANPVIEVQESYDDNNPVLAPFIGLGTAFYSMEPSHYYGIDQGIYDGYLARHLQTGIDPAPDSDFDATIKLNFHGGIFNTPAGSILVLFEFFNYGEPYTNTVKYDLFSVLLHEVTHALGMASAMGEDDQSFELICKNNGNSFTRYDWHFGYYGNILSPWTFEKLLTGTEILPQINQNVNLISYPLRRTKVWINAAGPPNNHNLYAGVGGLSINAAYYTLSSTNSFLSHIGTNRESLKYAQQFSPGKYMPYVMESSMSFQEVKRQWTNPELRVILELGYSLNPIFAADNNINPSFSNQAIIANSPTYRNDYNIQDAYLVPVEDDPNFTETSLADFNIINSNTAANPDNSILTIDITNDTTLVDNDDDPVSIEPNSIFAIRGVSSGGNNHDLLSVNSSGEVITYTPEPGFFGRAEFGFYLWDGKERGALEVYTIDVFKDNTISYPVYQELVINGDFEDGFELRTWENPEKIYANAESASQPQLLPNSGGGHPYSGADYYILHSCDELPSYNSLGLNNAFGNYGSTGFTFPMTWEPLYFRPYPSISSNDNTRYIEPSKLISTLVTPLVTGEYYTLKFDLGTLFPFGQIGTDLSTLLDIQIIETPQFYGDINLIQEIEHTTTVETLVSAYEELPWQQVSITFRYCANEPAEYLYFNSPSDIGFIDNISLKLDPAPPVLTVNAGNDQYITADCSTAQINAEILNTDCGVDFFWSPSSGLSDPTILDPVASPSETTTYILTVEDLISGNFYTDTLTVFVNEPITYPEEIIFCASTTKTNLINYVSPDGGTFSGPGVFSDGTFDPTNMPNGEYEITYTLGDGCAGSFVFTIIVTGFNENTASHPNGLTVEAGGPFDGATLAAGNYQFLGNLKIKSGATYTLSDAHIVFNEYSGIIIEPGGTLKIVNYSILTKEDCAPSWKGIKVLGNENYSQIGSDAAMQGFCQIDHSTVEYAETGITNGGAGQFPSNTGGIIKVYYSTFKNCRTAVALKPYTNHHPVSGATMPINCKFYNTQFIWDATFPFINDVDNPMVSLMDVDQVTFSGCDFSNTHPGIFSYPNNLYKKAAIYGVDASVRLSRGCDGYPPYAVDTYGNCISGNNASTIEGFNYGVVLHGASRTSITTTNFNCYRGVWISQSKGVRFTQNTFSDLPANLINFAGGGNPANPYWPATYGAYFEFSTLYWIEGNTFNFPDSQNDVGLFVRASGGAYNKVYDNTFGKSYIGMLAYDDNRGLNQQSGLKIECNTFDKNFDDIVVGQSVLSIPPIPPGWGISHFQGMPQSPFQDAFPAGNYFTNTADYNLWNGLEWVNYYYHPNENLTNIFGITPVQLPDINACPSSFSTPVVMKQAAAAEQQNQADSLGNILDNIIDDGNTAALTTEVILADYSEAVELYYELMQVSPNLSEEVMIEAIHKEVDLPASLLTLILNSNPHAAKSGKIQKELDERMAPLAEYQRAMINEGLNLVSYKENLEARESYHRGKGQFYMTQLIIEVLSDTTGIDKIQAIENIITGRETVDQYYLLVDLYLNKGDINSAAIKLNEISSQFNLDPRRDAEYADFLQVYSLIFGLLSSGDTTLSQQQHTDLEFIVYRHSTLAAGLAMATLAKYTDDVFYEPLQDPVSSGKSASPTKKPSQAPALKLCKVYPNPSSGIILIEIPTGYNYVTATVFDAAGKELLKKDIESLYGRATLNMRHLSSGTFMLQLCSANGSLDEVHQVQIVK